VSTARPLLLALDTSTRVASVALFDGAQVSSESTWLAGREHSARLLIEIDLALERVGQARESLTGLVVAHGPGSFTGVRVALSVAKGIAAGLMIPAWGVNTLDVLARAAGDGERPVRAAVEAGRGRFATALYAGGAPVEKARLATASELRDLVREPTVLIGELPLEVRAELAAHPLVHLASVAAGLRRAGFLAELGWRAAQAGEPGEPTTLDAVYVS
jgi:tRNA threonylcarbamoyladenosine biosynthesis protein TsaB